MRDLALLRSPLRAVPLLLMAAMASTAIEAQELDLKAYALTFDEDFSSIDVSAWGSPPARWIAHTPWSGDFGDARFADPVEGFPFTVSDGVLRIEARKDSEGKWHSGLLASVDPEGQGFAQQYGYFEARMKFPPGPGVWPAFWLVGVDWSRHTAEIDVVEYYGHAPDEFHSVVHIWRFGEGEESWGAGNLKAVGTPLTDDFNTYGVSIDEQETVFYFNRQVIWTIETPEEFKTPFFPLVNLALGSGWPIDKTPSPSFLYVDYVRAYEKR